MKISKSELKRIIREELEKAVGVNEEEVNETEETVNEEEVNETEETVEEDTTATDRLAKLEEEIKNLRAKLEGN